MITYKILEEKEGKVMLQTEDTSNWLSKKEKTLVVKEMTKEEATQLMEKTKQQRQQQIQYIQDKVNSEISSIDLVLNNLKK